jgi:SagB-type dehydrogenase family enzyme
MTVSAAAVYGLEGVPWDDAAELYHEASKLYPSSAPRTMGGDRLLEEDPALRDAGRRAAKRYPGRRRRRLPEPSLGDMPLDRCVRLRRSERCFGKRRLTLAELSALLFAAYGLTHDLDHAYTARSVPSGGALYPLELYVLAARVAGLEPGLYHYDPFEHELEHVGGPDPCAALLGASLYPDVSGGASAVVLVSAMFWRTRIKYGLRGYRYALVESGHLAQGFLLAATALGLHAVPLAGFFDGQAEAALGLDGVDESVLYWLCVGPASCPGRSR